MPDRRLQQNKGRLMRPTVGVLATVAIAALFWRYLSLDILDEALEQLSLGLLFAALCAYLAVTALRALRFMAAGASISFGTAFKIAAVHSALLRVMPFRSGELAYGILLRRMGKSTLGEGIAVILMLRILDLAVICPVAAAVVGTVLSTPGSGQPVIALATIAVLLGAVFFFLGPVAKTFNRRLERPSQTAPRRFFTKLSQTLVHAFDIPLKQRFVLLGLTLGVWIGVLAWIHLTLLGIGLSLPVFEGIAVGVLGVVGSILPVSVLGSFGPMEGGLALGLSVLGSPPDAAATHSILASACTFAANWIVALPAWIWIWATGVSKGNPSSTRA